MAASFLPYSLQGILGLLAGLEGIRSIKGQPSFFGISLEKISFYLFLFCFLACFYIHFSCCENFLHVFLNNHPDQRWYYRIASLWSHHETSLFFWVFLCRLMAHLYLNEEEQRFVSFFIFCLLIYSCFDANPFSLTGSDLLNQGEKPKGINPLLYDLNMVWHPPLLYLSHVLLIVPCAKGLINTHQNNLDFIRISFTIQTLAIALGAFWAFTQLGWGGFWFWDPVETLSLLPWISCLMILHLGQSIVISKPWISSIPFGCVVVSLWFVRSGILKSVHSFADNSTAFYVLGYLTILLWGMIAIALFRQKKSNWPSVSSFRLMATGSLFLSLLILLIGVILPLINKIEISSGFFNSALMPCVVLSLCGYLLYANQHHLQKLTALAKTFSLLFAFLSLYFYHSIFSPALLIFLSLIMAGAGSMIPYLRVNPRMSLAHMGFCVLIFGAFVYNESPFEKTFDLSFQKPILCDQKKIVFQGTTQHHTPFLDTTSLLIHITEDNSTTHLSPKILKFHYSKQYRTQSDFSFHQLFTTRFSVLSISGIDTERIDQKIPSIRILLSEHYGLGWIILGVFLIFLSEISVLRKFIRRLTFA